MSESALIRLAPPWALMWTLAVGIYAGCKWLSWQSAAACDAPAWKKAAYLFAWPGLNAAAFLEKPPAGRSRRVAEWLAAIVKLALGSILFFFAARLIPSQHAYLQGWVGMIGLVLILHFGAFHMLACWWRYIGIDARPLMNHPLESMSLNEFWGRRWNTAFRDLAHRFLFRPCAAYLGPRWGLMAGFLFSGVVHDLVISVPARGGYGGPTIFFTIQGAATLFERSAFGRRAGLGSGWRARIFTFLVLVAPVSLLFHRPFVLGIVVPFMHALGAL